MGNSAWDVAATLSRSVIGMIWRGSPRRLFASCRANLAGRDGATAQRWAAPGASVDELWQPFAGMRAARRGLGYARRGCIAGDDRAGSRP